MKLHLDEILYHLNQSRLGKKGLKIVLTGCLLIFFVIALLIVAVIVFAYNYHAEIYDGLIKIFNFIFNDSPENVFRNFVQIIDNYIKNFLRGN